MYVFDNCWFVLFTFLSVNITSKTLFLVFIKAKMNNLCISCLSQEGLTDVEDNIELFEECTSIKVTQ